MRDAWFLIFAGVLVCTPLRLQAAPSLEADAGQKEIWISHAELMALPTSGPAWDALVNQAQRPVSPNLSDQDDSSNVRVLAKALVAARTGSEQARDEVLCALARVPGTEERARSLSVARELMAYVVAAELVGLHGDRALLGAFQWLHEQADYPAEGDDTWMPHVINRVYGTDFPAPVPACPGKAMGFTDWTHSLLVPESNTWTMR